MGWEIFLNINLEISFINYGWERILRDSRVILGFCWEFEGIELRLDHSKLYKLLSLKDNEDQRVWVEK